MQAGRERLLKIQERIKTLYSRLKEMIFLQENKMVFYVVLILFASLAAFLLTFTFLQDDNDKYLMDESRVYQSRSLNTQSPSYVQGEATTADTFYTKPEGELSKLMKKAGILYENGRVDEALQLFKRISLYSQSLADYNLGVIRIGERRYKDAIENFRQSIEAGDDVSLSAINASYSALKLNKPKEFDYFLNLAELSLANSIKAPYYSYLYGLVSYYKGQYFEALSPLLHPNSTDYSLQAQTLAAEMFLILGDDYSALEHLKKDHSPQNALALGMLYARNGNYVQAQNVLKDFLSQNPTNLEALSAMELIKLKLQEYADSIAILNTFIDQNKKPFFPIKVGLASQLFDLAQAQKNFWNRKFESHQSLQYKILFYYAPFKVFDAQQTFQSFARGGFESVINNVDEAIDSYVQGEVFSRINRDITEGLKEVYLGDLREALKMFLHHAQSSFQHPVLYYNIGLVYAQLGDFENAYSYFAKAYYLDNQDVMAGIFAIMAGQLTYQDTERLARVISANFPNIEFKNERERIFVSEFFGYVRGGRFANFDLLEDFRNPIHYAFQAVSAMRDGQYEKVKLYFSKLKEKYPKDLTTDLMYRVAKNYRKDTKEISLEFSDFFRRGIFSDMHPLYYGGVLTRELYVYLAFLTGNLPYVVKHLEGKLSSQEDSPIGTMQTLGLAYIYSQEFEKAFAVYNTLIDNLQEKDAKTKFMGAVAAIGAGHYNNATALLQISKIDSTATLESRYALALLYQQKGNLKSAVSLLQSVANKGFVSEFFDFSIDTSEILQKAQE